MALENLTEQFDALPRGVQEQLIRISRTAAGMSEDEKVWAISFYAGVTSQHALRVESEGVEAMTIVSAAMRIVNEIHGLAGGTKRPRVVS